MNSDIYALNNQTCHSIADIVCREELLQIVRQPQTQLGVIIILFIASVCVIYSVASVLRWLIWKKWLK